MKGPPSNCYMLLNIKSINFIEVSVINLQNCSEVTPQQ